MADTIGRVAILRVKIHRGKEVTSYFCNVSILSSVTRFISPTFRLGYVYFFTFSKTRRETKNIIPSFLLLHVESPCSCTICPRNTHYILFPNFLKFFDRFLLPITSNKYRSQLYRLFNNLITQSSFIRKFRLGNSKANYRAIK